MSDRSSYRREGPHPALAGGPLLIAHRGGAGLAPENTIPAFLDAVHTWAADMIELDVHATADGHCVVIHDPTVDRTTNGSGSVAAMSLDELRELDAGYRFTRDGTTFPYRGKGVRIPTISEVFEMLPSDMRFTVELKTAAAQEPLLRAIRDHDAEQRVIAAGERDAFRTRLAMYPGPTSASREQLLPFYYFHRLHLARWRRVPADVVQLCEYDRGHRILTPRLIRDLHRQGLFVHVWTVNERADMERLLDWGVDGILSDYPDRLAQVMHEKLGRRLPPGLAADSR